MCFGQEVTVADLFLLLVTGVAAGIVSTVASLASVVSYPVLLALGLPPLSANVTNTVSLLFTGAGAAVGSRPELAGQGGRIRRLGLVTALGGAAGAALLLLTPARTFEAAAPVLIGAASRAAPAPGGGRPETGTGHADRERNPFLIAALFCVAVYVGYFGAAGGILLLVVLTAMLTEPLARTNAIKNVVSGLANTVAAVAFALFGPVRWAAVLPLAAGFLIGGRIGPVLVRYLPARLLRVVIGLGGIALAVKLGLSATTRPKFKFSATKTVPPDHAAPHAWANAGTPDCANASGTCGAGGGGAAVRKNIRGRDDRRLVSFGANRTLGGMPAGWFRCEDRPGRDDRPGTVFVAENFGFGFYSGASQRTPSGGRVSTADAGWPCHGSGTASIMPRLPTPLPP